MRRQAAMKRSLNLWLICFLYTAVGLAQSSSVDQSQQIRKVFIESEVNDAVHLALSSTRIGWTNDRNSADLILKFDREVSHTDKSQEGDKIRIGIHWTYTLIASLPDGSIFYRDSTPESSSPRTDKSEEGWLKYLRSTPEYTLSRKLAAQLQK
jgi:hypothetical protein